MAQPTPIRRDTDLLGTLDEPTNPEVVDLLDEIDEDDDAQAWMPEQPGEGVQGTVVAVSTTVSDYTPDPVPVVVIETADGTRWRITGYQSVLRREIEARQPKTGDLFAARYFGKKDGKRGAYHHFRVAVRPATDTPITAAPVQRSRVPF